MPSNETSWRESLIRLGRAFEVPDLRNRILFVMAMFAVYVAGLHIPAPLVKPENIPDMGAISGLLDIMSGGGFKKLSILALGIIPYINASIIMQLLGIAVPAVQRMQKEGDAGRKILSSYTRWGTVILAFLQSLGLCVYLRSAGALDNSWGMFGMIPIVIAMVAGTSFLMWIGEQLTDKGIGNGVSLIIFAGIMIRLPATFGKIYNLAQLNAGQDNILQLILDIGLIVVIFVAIVVFITYVHQAIRKIPIQHAKRVVGSRVFSSSNTYLPLKVVTAGVIPIIFAISVVMLPGTIAQFFEKSYTDQSLVPMWIKIMKMLSPGQHWVGGLIYFGLVVFFTYFYTAVVYN
ncbi:MAG: preprotein translocase subunit SecY, partial [bacterium]